jgi:hypothetical protein
MDDLRAKLKAMVGGSHDGGMRELRRALGQLTGAIAETLDSGIDQFDRLKADRQFLRDEIQAARTAAALIDSCHVLQSRVFPDADFEAFQLPRSRRRESLAGLFEDDIRPFVGARAFVYVAWRKNPEKFFYVGRSENKDGKASRLFLDNRGKLLDALHDATVFSVVLAPPRTSVNDIEASILRVLDDHDRFPEFNDRQERVPSAVGTKHLEQLGRFLVDIGRSFEASQEALTQIVRPSAVR